MGTYLAASQDHPTTVLLYQYKTGASEKKIVFFIEIPTFKVRYSSVFDINILWLQTPEFYEF